MAQPVVEPFKRVSVEEAKEMIRRGEVVIIDVRQPDEYARGHIPGAKLIPLFTLLAQPRELLQEYAGKKILFVCQVGQRSALACEMAAAVGLSELYNLEGGTERWAQTGNPIEIGS
jgi:rhodanese-related sulfurtransferase